MTIEDSSRLKQTERSALITSRIKCQPWPFLGYLGEAKFESIGHKNS